VLSYIHEKDNRDNPEIIAFIYFYGSRNCEINCVNFFAISLRRQINQISSLVATSRGELIDLIFASAKIMNSPISHSTCENGPRSICCIVHQALPPSSPLTPPPEGTVPTIGSDNHQVLLTFRISLSFPLSAYSKKKERKRKPSFLPSPEGWAFFLFFSLFLYLPISLCYFGFSPEISTICTFTPSFTSSSFLLLLLYDPPPLCVHAEGVFLRPPLSESSSSFLSFCSSSSLSPSSSSLSSLSWSSSIRHGRCIVGGITLPARARIVFCVHTNSMLMMGFADERAKRILVFYYRETDQINLKLTCICHFGTDSYIAVIHIYLNRF